MDSNPLILGAETMIEICMENKTHLQPQQLDLLKGLPSWDAANRAPLVQVLSLYRWENINQGWGTAGAGLCV